jgi:hypothetical protein
MDSHKAKDMSVLRRAAFVLCWLEAVTLGSQLHPNSLLQRALQGQRCRHSAFNSAQQGHGANTFSLASSKMQAAHCDLIISIEVLGGAGTVYWLFLKYSLFLKL